LENRLRRFLIRYHAPQAAIRGMLFELKQKLIFYQFYRGRGGYHQEGKKASWDYAVREDA